MQNDPNHASPDTVQKLEFAAADRLVQQFLPAPDHNIGEEFELNTIYGALETYDSDVYAYSQFKDVTEKMYCEFVRQRTLETLADPQQSVRFRLLAGIDKVRSDGRQAAFHEALGVTSDGDADKKLDVLKNMALQDRIAQPLVVESMSALWQGNSEMTEAPGAPRLLAMRHGFPMPSDN